LFAPLTKNAVFERIDTSTLVFRQIVLQIGLTWHVLAKQNIEIPIKTL